MSLVLPRNRRTLMGGEFQDQEVRGDFRLAQAYKAKFERCRFIDSPFGKSDFRGAVFTECIFEKCDFAKSDFNAATVKVCTFVECDFDLVDFTAAWITETQFIGGRMEYSKFQNSTLRDVKFETQLHGSDLRYASAENINYGGSNVWGASINVNCNSFRDMTWDERSVRIYLALLASSKGNDDLRARIAELAGEEAVKLIARLELK